MKEQELFKKLQLQPEFRLPASFPEKMRLMVQKKEERRRTIRFYLSSAISIVLTFIGGYVLVRIINSSAADIFISALWSYKWILATIVICFLSTLFFDQKLVKKMDLR